MTSLLRLSEQLIARGLQEDHEMEADLPEMMTAEVDPSSMTANRDNSELPIDMSEWSADEVAAYTALRSKRKKCCIGGCTHRSLPIARSYHQLPVRNKEVWAKWIEVIRWSRNEPEWTPNGDAAPLVCSRHFTDTDFISYEASSRVRLSHTAIPMYFVDPPEGTEMDTRFENPLPIPPIAVPRQKDTKLSKTKKIHRKSDQDGQINGIGNEQDMKYVSSASSSPQYRDNLSYDIEEVTEENERDGDNDLNITPGQFPFLSLSAILAGANNNTASANLYKNIRIASQTSTPMVSHQQRSRNLKYANSSSKPPGLIRVQDNFALHSNPMKRLLNNNSNVTISKVALPISSNLIKPMKTPPTKHKIGLAKCRLIVQTLENQLKVAKTRLAEQLEVPYQVVNGVWNMRDSLKDKL